MTDNLIERLASKSNAGQESFSGPKIPTVKLDGSGAGETAGQVLMFNDSVMTNLGTTLSLQIIRVRKKLMLGGELSKMFTEEYDSPTGDKITLRKCIRATDADAWSKPEVVLTGTASEIRAQHPVKVVSVAYAIMNGDTLVKLLIKGSSTTGDDGFYTYADSFKTGAHMFQFSTEITTSKVQKNRAISYHRMHFKRGAQITEGFELVEQYLDMIEGTPVVATAPTVAPTLDEAFDESF